MLIGLFATLFLREIPLRKAHNAPAAQQATTGPNRSRALLGLVLALMAREAHKPGADPAIVATLSNTVDGRYPHTWSDEERARAVARDIIAPLSITLLASSVANGNEHSGEALPSTAAEAEASDLPAAGSLLG